MAIGYVERIGRSTNDALAACGDFFVFAARAIGMIFTGSVPKTVRLLLPQVFDVGVRSVPVIAVTGAFIGMVMAIETYAQFKTIGQENHLGSIIILSVVKQIGPVLTAVMLAGRIGGALTAELGTMNVTEQIDALRVMGSDPIRYLVAPRFLACIIMTPVLTAYSDLMGIMGGWFIGVRVMGVPNSPFWTLAQQGVDFWQVAEGIVNAFFFGGCIGMISCYKGFHCGAGASGVGRACTESFVVSFLVIIVLNFFFAEMSQSLYAALFGIRASSNAASGGAAGNGAEAGGAAPTNGHGASNGAMNGNSNGTSNGNSNSHAIDPNSPLLELRHVSKSFGKVRVLDNLSLNIEAGKCLVVLGPSGTGKSVLLKHIVGLLRPDSGEVHFAGQRIDNLRESRLMRVRLNFGFLFQMGALFDSMSVADNIAFPLVEHTSKKPGEIAAIVNRKLRMVGLPEAGAKFPAELSGGQRKRVALARAVALDPQVILYDEPTTGLDPIRSDVINELIVKLKLELHITSIVVTHDMASAFKVADRIVMLSKGSIIFDGTTDEIRRSDNDEVQRFIAGRASEEELAELRLDG